jgi:hypothetical protein
VENGTIPKGFLTEERGKKSGRTAIHPPIVFPSGISPQREGRKVLYIHFVERMWKTRG